MIQSQFSRGFSPPSDDILVSDLHISTIFRLTLGAEAMAGIEISKAAEVGVEAGCAENGAMG